jgi:hypothetical protein
MWLPKDERKLLALYFRVIGKPDERVTFSNSDEDSDKFEKTLGWKGGQEGSRSYVQRVRHAEEMLEKRGLLDVLEREIWEKTVSLSVQGYDLGRKYSPWWIRTGLWFAEYKHHWFWLIVSFLSGIIATLLGQLLLKVIL